MKVTDAKEAADATNKKQALSYRRVHDLPTYECVSLKQQKQEALANSDVRWN